MGKQFDSRQWHQEYDRVSRTPPEDTVLTTQDKSDVLLEVDLQEGKPPFITARISVPCIVGVAPAWYAASINERKPYGFRVIMLPKSVRELIQRYGVGHKRIPVKSIRVAGQTKSRKGYTGFVEEYSEEADATMSMESTTAAE